MRSITVAVCDQACKDIRVWAAARDTSVSGLVPAVNEIVARPNSKEHAASVAALAMKIARARFDARARDAAAKLARPSASEPGPSRPPLDFFKAPQNL
jgi:hypothetical protein